MKLFTIIEDLCTLALTLAALCVIIPSCAFLDFTILAVESIGILPLTSKRLALVGLFSIHGYLLLGWFNIMISSQHCDASSQPILLYSASNAFMFVRVPYVINLLPSENACLAGETFFIAEFLRLADLWLSTGQCVAVIGLNTLETISFLCRILISCQISFNSLCICVLVLLLFGLLKHCISS